MATRNCSKCGVYCTGSDVYVRDVCYCVGCADVEIEKLEAELAALRARCQTQDGEPSVEDLRAALKYFEHVAGDHIEIMNSACRALLRRMGEDA